VPVGGSPEAGDDTRAEFTFIGLIAVEHPCDRCADLSILARRLARGHASSRADRLALRPSHGRGVEFGAALWFDAIENRGIKHGANQTQSLAQGGEQARGSASWE
jgi:hypothetical protein